MIRQLSRYVGSTHPGAFYFASAVILSLSVNTLSSGLGAVPTPSNFAGLMACTLSSFVSAIALSTVAWRLETVRQLASEKAHDAGLAPTKLLMETVQAFGADIMVRLSIGVVGAVAAIAFLAVLR